MFGGKGGVGKTTCAAAAAWTRARRGQRVLLVSLDRAHSLGDCLGVGLGPEPRPVAGSRGRLYAAEVDAPRAFREWMRRHRPLFRLLGERATDLSADEVDAALDLTLPGVDELMGLRELLRLARARPDHTLVVDLPPTVRALRLMEAPAQLRQLARILGFVAGLEPEADALRALLEEAEFTWVTHPETLAWEETLHGLQALRGRGLTRQDVLVNRVTPAPASPCALCEARVRAEAPVLAAIRASGLPVAWLPAQIVEPRGAPALLRLRPRRGLPPAPARRRAARGPLPRRVPPWPPLPSRRRLVMFAGNGGVGKTSAAAAAALQAAERWSLRVLLLSSGLARSLADVLARPLAAGACGSVTVRELAEAPPGLAELFALMEVEEALAPGRKDYDLVVLDGAPTGHALRLLAMPTLALGWVQALLHARASSLQQAGPPSQDLVAASQALRRLRARLQDPEATAVVAVAQPSELSVLETRRLVKGLRAEGLRAVTLLVNGLRSGDCRACRRAARAQEPNVEALKRIFGPRPNAWGAPILGQPPRGERALVRWAASWRALPDMGPLGRLT